MKERFKFPQAARLRHVREFESVYNNGKKVVTEHLVLFSIRNDQNINRLGVSVSKKISKRVTYRNKLKRYFREIFRLNQEKLENHYDIVVVARRGAAGQPFQQIEREMIFAFDMISGAK